MYLTHEDYKDLEGFGELEEKKKEYLKLLNEQFGGEKCGSDHLYRDFWPEPVENEYGRKLFRVQRYWKTYLPNDEIKTSGTVGDIFTFDLDGRTWEEVEIGVDAE